MASVSGVAADEAIDEAVDWYIADTVGVSAATVATVLELTLFLGTGCVAGGVAAEWMENDAATESAGLTVSEHYCEGAVKLAVAATADTLETLAACTVELVTAGVMGLAWTC